MVARAKGACRSFPVNTEFLSFAVNHMFFEFGDIMSNIVNQGHFIIIDGKLLREYFPGKVRDHLAVGPCIVCCGCHGAEICLSFRTCEGGAGKLWIGKGNVVFFCCFFKGCDMVRADLVTKPPRSAMDHYTDLSAGDAECIGRHGIKYLGNCLNFEEMIACPKGAALRTSPGACLCADVGGIRPLKRPLLFAAGDVTLHAVSLIHSP